MYLTSSTGDKVQVSEDASKLMDLINNMRDSIDEEIETVPVKEFSTVTVQNLVDFLEHHKDNPAFIEIHKSKDRKLFDFSKDEWSKTFLDNLHKNKVNDFIRLASFLSANFALDVSCTYIHDFIRTKSPEELKVIAESEK